MKQFWQDFKKFISRGNVVDMAVAVIVGGAFTAIVTALTSHIIQPLINWIISLCLGNNGLESAYTILSPGYDELGNFSLSASIYIDWGALISAVINFFIIALVLFSILRVITKTTGAISQSVKEMPTREEKKELKKQGVDFKNREAVVKATAELREKNKPVPPPPKPTQEELLTQILEELKKSNKTDEVTE